MPTSIARAAVDAWVTANSPDLNTGEGNWLRVQAPGSDTRYGFWRSKIPAPRGAKIITATLHFAGVGSSGASFSLHVQRVSDPWAESTLTYNNQPGVTGGTTTLTQTQTIDALDWPVDVSAQVQTICDGAPNHGFRLATTDTSEHRFYSFNNPDFQPYLEVEWADVPDAPTEVSPAGGSAVSIAKPVLSWNYHDALGDDMQALRVEIKATNVGWTADPATGGFASPDFDTGALSSVDPELDLSTTAYGGISIAATEWWTVQVQNAAGNWSEWSDPVSFTRTAKGTLTLSSPTSAHITDPTPSVIWSLSGATQTGYRITVWDDTEDNVNPVYDTGRRSSTATSLTLPKGVISDETHTYRIRVRVWDTLGRASTPGDPSHTEVVTSVTYVDGAPARPSAVVVSQATSGQPHVAVAITIASAPDFFSIVRNGKIIDLVDPTDLPPPVGTTYTYKDRSAAPNRDYEYKVRSKIGTDTGPARVATPDPFSYRVGEVWLLDWTNPASGHLVPIRVAIADCTFSMPDVVGNYNPINSDRVITITHSLQGLSGHIVGRIVATAGLSAEDSVADMLWFKDRPTNQLRMTLGAQNLRVEIQNVDVKPLATSDPDSRGVEFDFSSLDGVTQ